MTYPVSAVTGVPLVFKVGSTQLSVAEPVATVTVALAVAVAPAPFEQTSVNVVVAVSAPVDCAPVSPGVPGQVPVGVHDTAFVALHCSVELPPVVMLVGVAVSTRLGAAAVTETCVD
jgi:hypothetical protein